jgi:hypothetical protein
VSVQVDEAGHDDERPKIDRIRRGFGVVGSSADPRDAAMDIDLE